MAKTARRQSAPSGALVRMSKRPALPKVDLEMQRWSAVLEQEISTWPHVTSRPMFGMLAFYRDKRIFAALPRTRAAETPFSLLIKLPRAGKERAPVPLGQASSPGAGWVTFEMTSEDDIGDALGWLERAFERARTRKR